MKDCIFYVADKSIEGALKGLFASPAHYTRIDCGAFQIDVNSDIRVAAGQNDPGLHKRAHFLLQPFQPSYRHAVVMLDRSWGGAPEREAIKADIENNLALTGWTRTNVAAIVIDPELENWIWIDSPHVATTLGYGGNVPVRDWLQGRGLWPEGKTKPPDPKLALLTVIRHTQKRYSSALFTRLIERATIRNCTDAAFLDLKDCLRRWFPA